MASSSKRSPNWQRRQSWFADALADPDLFIGIRDNYLNVYSKGQSLFKAVWRPKTKEILVTTHVKYLVDPSLKEQIRLSGHKFDIVGVKQPLAGQYVAGATLKRIKKAAAYYSGEEKIGLHDIVMNNSQIIDLEVAMSKKAAEEEGTDGEPSRATAPRIDAASLEEIEGKIHLCFWEAKHYENATLWSTTMPPVVAQVEEYRALVQKYKKDMLKSYCLVAQNLRAISKFVGNRRELSQLVIDVANGAADGANGRQLVIDEPPHIGIIVFGYTGADKKTKRYESMCNQISNARLALAMKGDTGGFKLRSPIYL